MNSSWEGGPGLWHMSRCRIERDCSLCVSPLSRTQKSGFSHGQNYPSNCRNPAGKALKKWEEDSCCTCFCQRGVKLQPKGSPRNYREGQNKVQTCGVQGGLESPFNSQVFGSRGVWEAGSGFHLLLVQPCPTSSRFSTSLSPSGAKNKPEGVLPKKGIFM